MKTFITLVTLLTGIIGIGQNIIPNGDWELGPVESSDPFTGWNSNGPPTYWEAIATPDRIVYGSPALSRDGDPAQSGNAYCVFYGPPYSEGGKCELVYPVEAGTKYYLCYWLDVDENFDGGPGRMQFIFSGGDTIHTPYVTNTGDWQYFDTSFVASSNSDSLYLFANGNNLMKIDNMNLDTVQCDSTTNSIGFWENQKNEIKWFPNPAHTEIYFSKEISSVSIYNSFGQLLVEERHIVQLNVAHLPKGLYFMFVDGKEHRFLIE